MEFRCKGTTFLGHNNRLVFLATEKEQQNADYQRMGIMV